MNDCLNRLITLLHSLRPIREIHAELLQAPRGDDKSPGEFHTTLNWIGAKRMTSERPTFVPPPVTEMGQPLDNFERFLHVEQELPVLTG